MVALEIFRREGCIDTPRGVYALPFVQKPSFEYRPRGRVICYIACYTALYRLCASMHRGLFCEDTY